MGKSSRKIAKNNEKKQGAQKEVLLQAGKHKIREFQAEGEYDEALEQVIELLETENYDADIFFAAADTYFMAGDYDRAAVWVNKTLDLDPANVAARILLARICMLQERIGDALNIVEFVLRMAREALLPVEQEQIEEILDYFRYTQDLVALAHNHPYVADFIGIAKAEDTADVDAGKHYEAKESILPADEAIEISDDGQKDPAAIKEEILSKDISLQEKISLLNSFAGAYYYEHETEAAKLLLLAAKDIDCHNEETIRNLIVLALDENDQKLALQYLSLMGKMDFSLIKIMKM